MKSLRCLLGFHKFQYTGVDKRFLPKVLVLLGKCSRLNCIERQNFFFFRDSKKIVVENHGLNKICGEYTVMPMRKDDLEMIEKVEREG